MDEERAPRDVSSAIIGPMRFFNTEGPVRQDEHYAIRPLDRVDIDEFLGLIRAKRYFVLHAPRQTGKTSALISLRDLLNSGEVGNFRCVNVNVEVGQVARDDTARGIRSILTRLRRRGRGSRGDWAATSGSTMPSRRHQGPGPQDTPTRCMRAAVSWPTRQREAGEPTGGEYTCRPVQ